MTRYIINLHASYAMFSGIVFSVTVKIVPEMTYNVSSGTLSLYTTTTSVSLSLASCLINM